MALPKIEHPTFTLELISTGKKIKYRPFTVKEEKIILVAQASKDLEQIVDAMKQVILNCVVEKNFDVDKLATFDIEYLFLNLRSKSVSNEVNITLQDYEDKKNYDFTVNLDEVKIVHDVKHNKKIELMNGIGVIMRYPNYEITSKLTKIDRNSENIVPLLEMIAACIEQVYQDDKFSVAEKDFTLEEAIDFITSLPVSEFDKFKDFFDTFPKIEYTINYKNSLGNERSYTLSGIADFFI